jgi:hypothetical protein
VVDPFAGSCVTEEVAKRLERQWVCIEMERSYLEGAKGRFLGPAPSNGTHHSPGEEFYRVPRAGLLWNGSDESPLPTDGGKEDQKLFGVPAPSEIVKRERSKNIVAG